MAGTKAVIARAKRRKAARVAQTMAARRQAEMRRKRTKRVQDDNSFVWIDGFEPIAAVDRTLRFGQVVVTNRAPDRETVRSNIDEGRQALRRATEAFTTTGLALPRIPGVPRFSVDAHRPDVLIRDLNGVVQRGRIVGGAFVPAD